MTVILDMGAPIYACKVLWSYPGEFGNTIIYPVDFQKTLRRMLAIGDFSCHFFIVLLV